MTPCVKCHNPTHVEHAIVKCDGCNRSPVFCRCEPIAPAFRPAWLRNLDAKDFSGELRAA